MESTINLSGIEVKFGAVCNLIRSAMEAGRTHGCGYWCYADDEISIRPDKIDLSVLGEFEKDEEEAWYVHWAMFDGGKIGFVEHDGESNEPKPVNHTLDLEKISAGLALMANKYPHKFAEVMTDEIDGPLGEEFLQLCLLGELKYG